MAIWPRLTRNSGATLRRLLPIKGIGQTGMVAAGATSIMLRALLLLGKFAFIVALARYTNPATVGLYALLVTIVTIAIYVIGLELHTSPHARSCLTMTTGEAQSISRATCSPLAARSWSRCR